MQVQDVRVRLPPGLPLTSWTVSWAGSSSTYASEDLLASQPTKQSQVWNPAPLIDINYPGVEVAAPCRSASHALAGG